MIVRASKSAIASKKKAFPMRKAFLYRIDDLAPITEGCFRFLKSPLLVTELPFRLLRGHLPRRGRLSIPLAWGILPTQPALSRIIVNITATQPVLSRSIAIFHTKKKPLDGTDRLNRETESASLSTFAHIRASE